MTITVDTPVKAQSLSDVSSLTLSNFVVGAPNQLLLVWVFHEGAYTLTDTGVSFGGTALTKVLEVKQTSGNQTGITVWGLANPSVATANIVATMSAAWSLTFEAMLIGGADLSGGLASAINGSGAFQVGTSGTDLSANISPTVGGTTIIDAGLINDAVLSLSAKDGQILVAGEQVTGGSAFTYKIGKIDGGVSGARVLGYTSSGSYARASYGSIAIKSAAATTLSDLTLAQTTANRVPGETVSWTVTGKSAGSSVTVNFDDGSSATTNTATLTKVGGFAMPGNIVGVPVETLIGASNTPHHSPSFGTRVLTQWKVAVLGSSTADFWFTNTFNTIEAPHTRLYAGSGGSWSPFTTYVGATGKGAGGIAFGNLLIAKLGEAYRVDLLDCGLGGTWLKDWANKEPHPISNFGAMISAIDAVGGVDAAVCHVGSNDARSEGVLSRVQHETIYRALIGGLRSETEYPTLPFFVMGCQRAPVEPGTSDIYWARARSAEQTVAEDPNVYLGTTVVDLPMYVDNTHLSEGNDGGNAVGARRTAHTVYNALFGGTERFIGPKPGGSTYNPATGWIRIAFSLAPGLSLVGRTGQENLTGFAFAASGSPASPIIAPFVSGPAEVAARLATSLASVTYAYQETANPDVSNCLFDNGLAPAQP